MDSIENYRCFYLFNDKYFQILLNLVTNSIYNVLKFCPQTRIHYTYNTQNSTRVGQKFLA